MLDPSCTSGGQTLGVFSYELRVRRDGPMVMIEILRGGGRIGMMAISWMIHDWLVGGGGKGGPIVREIEEEGWSHYHGSFYASVNSCARPIPQISYTSRLVKRVSKYILVDRLVSCRKGKRRIGILPSLGHL